MKTEYICSLDQSLKNLLVWLFLGVPYLLKNDGRGCVYKWIRNRFVI